MKVRLCGGTDVVKWVLEKAGGGYRSEMTGLGVCDEAFQIRAAAVYENWTGPGGSIFMHSRIDSPFWCSRFLLFHVFDYPFSQLQVERVFGIVGEDKASVIEFNRKLGFRVEGALRNFFPSGPAIVMSMGKSECKWLDYSPGLFSSNTAGLPENQRVKR